MTTSRENRPALDPVLAHSFLGTVAAAKGAIDTVMAHKLDGTSRDALLMMATRRLDHLAEQLRHLALGLPELDEIAFSALSARATPSQRE